MSADLKQPRESTDSSAPLIGAYAAPSQNPLPSPTPSPLPPSEYVADEDPAGTYKFSLATPLRVLIAALTFISAVLQLQAQPDEVAGVAANVLSWAIAAWNVLVAFPHICAPLLAGSSRVPQVSFVVGGRETVLFGARGKAVDGGNRGCGPAALVDLALALALLVVEVLMFVLPWHHWWNSSFNCYGIIAVNGVVVFLMFIVAFFGLFPRRGHAHFVVRPGAYGDRIQLP
ncbi:hypothetical protein F4810DRAFT_678966 [Camillea tinctor]|nr:hypothetical protein F4810DRAFT_678966 [Camillea tinctor]